MVSIDKYSFPAFDDLPSVPGQPQGCLWGFFDKDGNKDELGSEFRHAILPWVASLKNLTKTL